MTADNPSSTGRDSVSSGDDDRPDPTLAAGLSLRKDAPDKNRPTEPAGTVPTEPLPNEADTEPLSGRHTDTARLDTTHMDTTRLDTAPGTVRPAGPDVGKPAGPDTGEPAGHTTGTLTAEDETWARFAPAPQRPPGLVRRALAAVGRFLGHEWTLVSVAAVLLAVLMTWPTVLHPTSTIPHDIYDPLLQTWQVAWDGHAVLTDPLHLWDSNTFYPETDTLAFSDSLLGYAPAGMIGSGPVAALIRYNVLYVLVYALAFVGMYALCRQLGSRRPGAAMAAAAFAYAPWRLAHGGHLNILSTGGIALALAMLARGHGFRLRRTGQEADRPRRLRWGWALGGWLVAAWQVTLGFGLGLPFGYALGLLVLVALVAWVVRRLFRNGRPVRGGRVSLLLANLGGLVVFVSTCLYMGLPYLHAVHAHPHARRSTAELALFSPPWQGFFIAPAHSWLWGDVHAEARQTLPFQPEMTLLVGMVLLAFALLGLVLSVWRVRTRLLLAFGVAVSVVLAMGTRFPGGGKYTYLLLYNHLPAWDAIRTPGRLVVWTTLLLGLLAAGAVSALGVRADEVALSRGRNPRRLGPALRVLLAVPLVLVLIEGWNTMPHPTVPTEPAALHGVTGPVLILPTDQLTDQRYMYWSTDGFPRIVNGGSGVQPTQQDRIRQVATGFPDQRSVAYLRQLGVRTVVVLPDNLAGTPYQGALSAPVDGLDITREDTGSAVVYSLH